MSRAFHQLVDTGQAAQTALVSAHIFGGFLIFVLMGARLFLRLEQGVPAPPAEEPQVLQTAAKAAHWGFYALLLALPVTGAVAWFQASEVAGDAHEVLRAALLFLILAHVGGALYHRFILKTDVLSRMTRMP